MKLVFRCTLLGSLLLWSLGPAQAGARESGLSDPHLPAFRSARELNGFLLDLARKQRVIEEERRRAGRLRGAPQPMQAAAAPAAEDQAESVTNVQHAGVDEGGIVKLHGDHLVILRRGRLFTVDVRDRRLAPVSAVDAFGPDLEPRGTWYDELLVSGSTVIVIGYSYARGGTEIGLFEIDGRGELRHRSTYQLRSNDYYSSRNYASRLVEGKLVFYTPLGLNLSRVSGAEDVARLLPAMRRWRGGRGEEGFQPIATATRVYRPARPLDPRQPLALHTVTTCEIAGGELSCEATCVFGSRGHNFYVSPRSVYVWLSEWRGGSDAERSPAMLYRMPLDGSAPQALGVMGSPIDQFSFLESEDGHLNVLVASRGRGQWMWQAERTRGELALLRVPLAELGDGSRDAAERRYRGLASPGAAGYALQNRFVGEYLLYGRGSGWGRPAARERQEVFVVNWRNGSAAALPLPHGVDRIEALGSAALVVGADAEDLHFTSVRLRGGPRLAGRHTVSQGSQGELRSHGFFYRADGEDEGMLGLPVRGAGRPGYEHLLEGSASIVFLRNRSLQLAPLGGLEARPERSADDGCVASCVDWYGNARPLFLRGRVFALLGYELVEGELRNGAIHELRRVSFSARRERTPTR